MNNRPGFISKTKGLQQKQLFVLLSWLSRCYLRMCHIIITGLRKQVIFFFKIRPFVSSWARLTGQEASFLGHIFLQVALKVHQLNLQFSVSNYT